MLFHWSKNVLISIVSLLVWKVFSSPNETDFRWKCWDHLLIWSDSNLFSLKSLLIFGPSEETDSDCVEVTLRLQDGSGIIRSPDRWSRSDSDLELHPHLDDGRSLSLLNRSCCWPLTSVKPLGYNDHHDEFLRGHLDLRLPCLSGEDWF